MPGWERVSIDSHAAQAYIERCTKDHEAEYEQIKRAGGPSATGRVRPRQPFDGFRSVVPTAAADAPHGIERAETIILGAVTFEARPSGDLETDAQERPHIVRIEEPDGEAWK